jgi:diguanylate cyclase (GGDEF)-like protein
MLRRSLVHLHEILSKLGKQAIFTLALLLIALFGYLDYLTGFEIASSFFYLIPITIAVWYIGQKAGGVVIAIYAILWLASNWQGGETCSSEAIHCFNASIRLVLFSGFSSLLNELKLALSHEHSLSRTDHLTGVHNSREFFDQAALELERAHRLEYPLSIAYIDVDNFKQINDRFGHSEGDKLLKLLAQTTTDVIRKVDIFARIGGDEFVILFPNTDQEGALSAARKMESAIADRMKALPLPLTLSIGLVTFTSAPFTVDKLLQTADEVMYRSKKQGKSRITSAQIDRYE